MTVDHPQTLVDVSGLQRALQEFARARDWTQFHSPKNLTMALSAEVGELTELFQWMSEADSLSAAQRSETAQAVRDELADVLCYLVRLADRLDVDLDAAVRHKLMCNERKYPVALSKGNSTKASRR